MTTKSVNKSLFDQMLDAIPAYQKKYVQKKCIIAVQISKILHDKNLSQKELADELGVTEARLSKILSGSANLTIKSIAKIEATLGEDIIQVPMFAKKETKVVYVVVSDHKYPFGKSKKAQLYSTENYNLNYQHNAVHDPVQTFKTMRPNNYG